MMPSLVLNAMAAGSTMPEEKDLNLAEQTGWNEMERAVRAEELTRLSEQGESLAARGTGDVTRAAWTRKDSPADPKSSNFTQTFP